MKLKESAELVELRKRIERLETALLDYVEVYGLREKAREILVPARLGG